MQDNIYLKDTRHPSVKDIPVCDWDFVEVPNHKIRVYYKVDDYTGAGFIFYAIENVGGVATPEYDKNDWDKNCSFASCLFQGIAYFDGVRHLYVGDEATDNFGYHYYPDLESLIDTLKIIKELEQKYCNQKYCNL